MYYELFRTSKANFDLSLKQCYQLALAEIGLLTSDPCWVLLPIRTLWGPAGVDVVPILFWPLNTQLHSVCNFHFLSLCPFSLFSVCPSCSRVDLWVLFGNKDPVLHLYKKHGNIRCLLSSKSLLIAINMLIVILFVLKIILTERKMKHNCLWLKDAHEWYFILPSSFLQNFLHSR